MKHDIGELRALDLKFDEIVQLTVETSKSAGHNAAALALNVAAMRKLATMLNEMAAQFEKLQHGLEHLAELGNRDDL